MEINFRFKIGDLVATKIGIEEARLHCVSGELVMPTVAMVVGLVSDTCPGGTQLFCKCSRGPDVMTAHESELVPISEIPRMQLIELYCEGRAMMHRADDAARARQMDEQDGAKD